MKRVLLIAFDFPPRRTSGVYRPTAFTKYLPQNGWQPTVLTIDAPEGVVVDVQLLRRVPSDVVIKRTRLTRLDLWEGALLRVVRRASAIRDKVLHRRQKAIASESANAIGETSPEAGMNAASASTGDASVADLTGTATSTNRMSLPRAVAAAIRSFLYFPDATAGWIPHGLAAALRMHRDRPFDVIYTTHPPRAAHVIGMLMNRITGVPWVVEFRDPWTIPDNERAVNHEHISAPRRNRWLHDKMLRWSNHVVTVTARHAKELEASFGVPAEKISVITNGFDEDDFVGIEPNGFGLFDPQYVNFAQFGTVYSGFSGRFFEAAAELLTERPELADRVRFHIIGYPDPVIEAMAQHPALKDAVVLHGFLAHAKVLPLMHVADALLLFYGHDYTSRTSIPGKLYEYLRVGKPIVAIAYPGGVREIITSARAGSVLDPDDVPAIKAEIERLVALRDSGQPAPRPDAAVVARFRYDSLTRNLSKVLDDVIAQAQRSHAN